MIIDIKNLYAGYKNKNVIKDLSLEVNEGELIGVIGLSGAGKSTLLQVLIGFCDIYGGECRVLDKNIKKLKNKELDEYRKNIGIIYQNFNLIDRFTTLDNVASGMLYNISLTRSIFKRYTTNEYKKCLEIMDSVGISELYDKRCSELSGGSKTEGCNSKGISTRPKDNAGR